MPESAETWDAFANALVSTSLEDTLDPDTGLAVQWRQAIEDRLSQLAAGSYSQSDEDALTLEAHTWLLVQRLYAERQGGIDRAEYASSKHNPYLSPEALSMRLLNASQDLSELQAICVWLEEIATANPAEPRRGYLPYTRAKLKHCARTGEKRPATMISELDPDATLRTEGSRLADEDEVYDSGFLRSIFEHVRAGETDVAVDLCRQSDLSWRAASLMGATFFGDNMDGPDTMMMDDGDEPPAKRRKGLTGNVNRRLWRQVCRKISSNASLKVYERALYGHLSGDVDAILPACESWEDHLWAYAQALLGNELERRSAEAADGQFWLEGQRQGDRRNPVDVKQSLQETFERLQENGSKAVRTAATHPLRVAQRYLVLGQIDRLFDEFAANLEARAADLPDDESGRLIRFFAHLALFLRRVGQPLPQSTFQILEGYTRVLESHDMNDLIAYYAAQLDQEEAVETYAAVLQRTHPTLASREARREQLERAQLHNLDVADVARRTVEMILADALANPPAVAQETLFQANVQVSDLESELIKSIEWLSFYEATYIDALRQANALTRFFLASGKSHAARQLIISLPPDLPAYVAAQSSGEDDPLNGLLTEHSDYRLLFSCLQSYGTYMSVWAKRPAKKQSRAAGQPFSEALSAATSEFYELVMDLLRGQWLDRDQHYLRQGEDVNTDGRLHELSVVRQIYIPELVFRLHRVLYDSHVYVPGNLQLAIDLVQVVAEEELGLWREFVGTEAGTNRLPDLLDRVRESSLASLDGSGSPFLVTSG